MKPLGVKSGSSNQFMDVRVVPEKPTTFPKYLIPLLALAFIYLAWVIYESIHKVQLINL